MNKVLNNLAVVLVFLTLAAFSWLWGGSRADKFLPLIPWLWVFLFEALLFFPQRKDYETTAEARSRVTKALKRDPIVYLAILFLLILIIPFFNQGLCQVCDYPRIVAGEDAAPPLPYLPFCVDAEEHFGVLLWFLPMFTALLAAKHSLIASGKRLLLEFMVWNATLLEVLGFCQASTGAEFPFWEKGENPVYFFSTFGYPNMGGSFFLMMFAFSIGLWQYRMINVEESPMLEIQKSRSEKFMVRMVYSHYLLIAVVANFFATLFTLCRAAILMLAGVSVLAIVYSLLRLLFARHQRAQKIKKAAFLLGWIVVFIVSVAVFAPKEVTHELNTVSTVEALDRVSGRGQYHTRVAGEIFKEYPLFGVGGWGYRHFCMQYMTDEEMKEIQVIGGINVHNDSMQFLCEHGIVGYLALLSIFIILLVPIFRAWYALYHSARFTKKTEAPPRPLFLYSLPAGTFWVLVGNACVVVHTFADCPLRSAAVLTSFFVSLACAPGFLQGVPVRSRRR
jgi:hypothetical protein